MTSTPTVDTAEMTCFACPTQIQGMLSDGNHYYFRYRYGHAFLGIGPTHDDAVGANRRDLPYAVETLGDDLDGSLDFDEAQAAIERMIPTALESNA